MLKWPDELPAKLLRRIGTLAGFLRSNQITALAFPPECAFCQETVPLGQYLCKACLSQLAPNRYCCQRCAMPLADVLPNKDCSRCRDRHWHFSNVVSLGNYQGKLREAVILCKKLRYENLRFALSLELAQRLLARFPELDLNPPIVVPIPYHWSRAFARTASTANSLAELLGYHNKWPVASRLVRRIRKTGKQGMLTLSERQQNVRGAFQIVGSPKLTGRHVLIVDDVLTSGATADELATQLQRTKPDEITVVTLARATGT